ncbi:hypothetical protein HaLaN_14849 [Haematococcus lacustris]|uniref:Uncharacterized protein n=1 Tax=Haematococcus lacustris TaxID=44745 RepID=A0A699Z937_HAELA|nr:hypothetical protein HaLaN_14849 [Haematococcus lacustris]
MLMLLLLVQVAVDDGTLVRDFSRASPSPTCCSAACQYGAKGKEHLA